MVPTPYHLYNGNPYTWGDILYIETGSSLNIQYITWNMHMFHILPCLVLLTWLYQMMYGIEWWAVYHKRVLLAFISQVTYSSWFELNSPWLTFKMGGCLQCINEMSNSPREKYWHDGTQQRLSMLIRFLLCFWKSIYINHAIIKNEDCAAQWKLPVPFSYHIPAMMINIQMQNTFLCRRMKHGTCITG